MNNQKGFARALLVILILIITISSVYFYIDKNIQSNSDNAPIVGSLTSNGSDARADYFFQKWLASYKNNDYITLSRIFNAGDHMSSYNSLTRMRNYTNSILNYDKYFLYKSITRYPSAKQIEAFGKDYANNVSVETFYIASKSDNEYYILQLNGEYRKDREEMNPGSYETYSGSDNKPVVFKSSKEAELKIDKLYDSCISNHPEYSFCLLNS